MRVLVTGALGSVGRRVIVALLEHGHEVRALDLGSQRNRARARAIPGPVEWIWGDIRIKSTMEAAVAGMEGVIHLAAVLPPQAYKKPAQATAVNLDGARTVLGAANSSGRSPVFIYTSSAAVYGLTQHETPPVSPDHPTIATDAYTRDKLAVEQIVRSSSFPWIIIRLSHVPILGLRAPHRIMFDIPLDNRMELLHADDAALAIVNALTREEVYRKTLLVGGGRSCRVLYREYLELALAAIGLDPLPAWAFGSHYHYTDWLDTAKSQELLAYQRHSFADIQLAIEREGPRLRPFIRAFAPALTRWLLLSSPQRATTGRRRPRR